MPKISELKQQEDRKTPVCDKHDRDITCEFGHDPYLTMCSGLLQKNLLKGGDVLWRKFVFKRN